MKEQHSYLDINPIPHPSHREGKTEKNYSSLMEALTKSLITDFSSLMPLWGWEEPVMGGKSLNPITSTAISYSTKTTKEIDV